MFPIVPMMVLVAAAAGPDGPGGLFARLHEVPADSIGVTLRAAIAAHPADDAGAAALMLLGRYDYARGEYRAAAATFARAAARLEPARKPEARYWAGLAWLALGEHQRARASLAEVARVDGPRRAQAQLALAQIWEAVGRPAAALDEIEALLAGHPAEAGATALAMQRQLAMGLHRDAEAQRAAERLLREYPNSVEAARIVQHVDAPASAQGHTVVLIGAFSDPARARSLAAAARRAGFAEVRVVPPTGAGAPLHMVRLGPYADPDQARRQAERAADLLGVIPERIQTP